MGEELMNDCCCATCNHCIEQDIEEITCYCTLKEQEIAADKMIRMYDEIRKENNFTTPNELHGLNVFIARLLFCFFAEDTGIFEDKLFTRSLHLYTQEDGSDLDDYLRKVFNILDVEERLNLPTYLCKFPYVGGGLFKQEHIKLKFSRKSRQAIIDNGELDWSSINLDIFGSMIQTVVNPNERSNFGMHYTSEPNVMKVLEPLFLNDLYEELHTNQNNVKKMIQLIDKISKIRLFDPACGSGNFLIIAYKELRKLEMEIIIQINKISNQQYLQGSTVSINQCYGIEIDDFAHEIAVLSLWLIEHKMNMEFYRKFNYTKPSLPLQELKNIVHDNATRVEWESICPTEEKVYTYVIGNPPYIGSKKQDKDQKADMSYVFRNFKEYKNLDYVACWFYLGSRYIKNLNTELAFVSTNSIVQGDQVGLLWPHIFNQDLEIGFAHKPFKWGNNAKSQAAVICVVVSVRKKKKKDKYILDGKFKKKVGIIGPYLNEGSSIIVHKRTSSISNLPEMVYGNMPLEGGFLKLTPEEKEAILKTDMRAAKFIRPVIGGEEFLKGISRYCLWINDEELPEALDIVEIRSRIKKVKEFRQNGGEVAKTLVAKPHQFRYRKEANESFIIIPCTSSERREYIPCGFYDKEYITLNSVQVIYDSEPYIFGIISSRLHMMWVKTVAGRLKSDYRYSNVLCYNTFPIPELSQKQKQIITEATFRILEERERNSQLPLGQLYDPDKMPEGLKKAHDSLDILLEKIYNPKGFKSDDERISFLLNLYDIKNSEKL